MKNYNVTALVPEKTFNKHIYHRDQFAHYLRWSHVLKKISKTKKSTVVDFGCGQGSLFKVMYHNRFVPNKYVGLDIRKQTIEKCKEEFKHLPYVEFVTADLCKNDIDYSKYNADLVVSFEVLEHVGKQNVDKFLENFKACGSNDATYYLSTPNYNENIGAAKNHIYDSGDGRGEAVQEFTYNETKENLLKYFDIINEYGTFASKKDYLPYLNDWQKKMYDTLNDYYDKELLANFMAPMFPEHSRNTMWILKRKK